MYSFLVLGLIPGTNIQISFQAWLAIVAVLAIAVVKLKSQTLRHLRRVIQWGKATAPRQTLHASQLHQRIS